ncbi:hypothetical protein N7513_003309 [Penicillium frequentans]|uniref:Uncharacterized protein n=1 Tax=Penicillium frequentans TaxID=3151616 RepID=A0AAD6D030_9EURO|nr:hypothetical protein N7494_005313 [Penicillium glabrum]KAJ5557723.1 hypothetical protein N7513_003309 [Penicillium glabrum]
MALVVLLQTSNPPSRTVSSGGREVGDLLARPACAANCDMLDNDPDEQRIQDSLTGLQLQ